MGIMPSHRRSPTRKAPVRPLSPSPPPYPQPLPPPPPHPTSTSDLQASHRKLQALDIQDLPRPLTAICTRPIPNSYWATPLLLACEYPYTPKNPSKPKLDALLRAGVRTFIDLTEYGELAPYHTAVLSQRCTFLGIDPTTVEYRRFPIRDRCLPESVDQMYAIMDALRDNRDRGRISAVHCRGGIGRTGMVIGCWLVESGVARDGGEALGIIAREWKSVEKCKRYPHSPETGPQFEFVAKFHPSPKYRYRCLEIEAAA
ncbi:protein-tyrosine phosphatase-like protein [Gymnopilus junonius]|uniref:Protein-tyrosine phosphatase-like protein n=1 Tax=Gymnopilus junonius TaxID=109634 RepID=A0A9P5NGT4_GYMJU|nr:protein-tyrosine phosphatase-like protein [Gymnopilus junonius]